MKKAPATEETPEVGAEIAESENAKRWLWKAGDPRRPKGGRPKGLAARIRERNPPERLASAFEDIAYAPRVAARDRMEALRWLSDHGYGKAPETHLVGSMTEDQREMAGELTRDQLLGLIDSGPVVDALPSGSAVGLAVTDEQVPENAGPTD